MSAHKADTLHIKHLKSGQYRFRGQINVFDFVDSETKQHICYIPAFEISGYGKNKKKALEMAKFTLEDFFNYLGSMNQDLMRIQLLELGWVPNRFFRKEFSHAYVDQNGVLQNFNPAGEINSESIDLSKLKDLVEVA